MSDIHDLAQANDVDGVIQLLASNPGAVIELDWRGWSPLHWAAYYNNKEVAKILVAASGARLELQDQYGQSPLYMAAYNNSKEIAELLLASGANVDSQNQYGQSPLYMAAYNNSKEIAELLLAAGACVDLQNKDGKTPLMIAKENNHSEIVKILEHHKTEEKKKQKVAEERSKQDNTRLLRNQQKYFAGDRVTVVNVDANTSSGASGAAATTGAVAGALATVGDVGEVVEYKVEDNQASYVVRVVSGTQKDQVYSYSPTNLIPYSEAMCQKLGVDLTLFEKYDRIIMTIRRRKLKALEAGKAAAIAARQPAKAREIASELKSLYIYDKAEAIPDSEMESLISSLLVDLDTRYLQLATEEKFEEAELCDSTKNELMQYYTEICNNSSAVNQSDSFDEENVEWAELFSFLKDFCHIGYSKAKHYSALMYSKHEIESIKNLKLLQRSGSLRTSLSVFISSKEDIDSIETAINQLLANTNNSINSPVFVRSRNKTSTVSFTADGKPVHDVRPLSESLNLDSANHISYDDIYTGHYLPPTGRVDVVIKVGDGRRDLAAEERILRYLRDSCREAIGVIRLIDFCPTSSPPYLVLEKYGEDIRSFFKSPEAARNFKRYILDLLRAMDSIHRVGIMHGDIKPQNILISVTVTQCGFKLCDFENSRRIGDVMPAGKYTKAWVSPEVFFASEGGRELRASAAVDVFSLGLILGALFDGNCYIDKTILPVDIPEDFQRSLSDQVYLQSLLPCHDSSFDKSWIHTMCSLDPSQRCTVSSIIRNFETQTRTALAMQNKHLKDNIDTKLESIDSKLTIILERVTSGFDSLQHNLKDLVQSSFENILNDASDDSIILKILTATADYSETLKGGGGGTTGGTSSSGSGSNLSEAKIGMKRMEDAIRAAIESQMSSYEADRKKEMSELQTTILTRCRDLETVLKDQSADSKETQSTINAIAHRTELLHQDLLEVRQELDSMKQNLLQLAENTRNIVASTEKLRFALDSLEDGLNRISESNMKQFQELNKSMEENNRAVTELTPTISRVIQGAANKTDSLLLTMLKGTYDIPTLVILLPEIATGVTSFLRDPSRLFTNKYRLFFVCSHTLCIAPCGPNGQGYQLSTTKEWVKKAAPVLKVGLVAVKLALATSGIPFPISDLLQGLSFPIQSDYFNAALQELQDISNSTVSAAERQVAALTKEDCLSFLDRNAEGTRAAYEGVKEMLKSFANISSSCGLVFVEHQGKVAWVLRGQEENWKRAFGRR